MRGMLIAVVALLGLLSMHSQASVMGFDFYQDGYANEGFISGSFQGEDLDGNGQLSSFLGEIYSFELTFSGDGAISPFELDFEDLFGLVYDLDGGILGDGMSQHVEGILAWSQQALFAVGPGPLWSQCGSGSKCALVSDGHGVNLSKQGVRVTASVPEPGTFVLLMIGVVGLVAARRRAGKIH